MKCDVETCPEQADDGYLWCGPHRRLMVELWASAVSGSKELPAAMFTSTTEEFASYERLVDTVLKPAEDAEKAVREAFGEDLFPRRTPTEDSQ